MFYNYFSYLNSNIICFINKKTQNNMDYLLTPFSKRIYSLDVTAIIQKLWQIQKKIKSDNLVIIQIIWNISQAIDGSVFRYIDIPILYLPTSHSLFLKIPFNK